jgi:hypothetical protein
LTSQAVHYSKTSSPTFAMGPKRLSRDEKNPTWRSFLMACPSATYDMLDI